VPGQNPERSSRGDSVVLTTATVAVGGDGGRVVVQE